MPVSVNVDGRESYKCKGGARCHVTVQHLAKTPPKPISFDLFIPQAFRVPLESIY
jgi:hypothetical protein